MTTETVPAEDAENGVQAAAAYIAELSSNLARMAGDHQLPVLAYLLHMASAEAEQRRGDMPG